MIKNRVTDFYIFMILTIFPLCFWDYYYDIANVKFIVFTALTLGAMLTGLFCKRKYTLSSPVKWIFLWCVANLLSFLFSSYKDTALMGTGGRDYGLITILCVTIMFLMVSSNETSKEKFINAFMVASVLVSLLAVMNSYGIDILGFYNGVRKDLRMFYQTTLGHVDICSSFFALSLPIAVVMAVKEKGGGKRFLYMAVSGVLFAGLFGSGCDSGYIIMATLMIAVIIWIKDYESMMVFAITAMIMLWVAKLMMLINHKVPSARNMDSIAVMVTDNRVVGGLSIVLAVLIFMCHKKKKGGKTECKSMKRGLLFIIAFAGAVFLAAFVYFTFIDKESKIGAVSNLLRFNEDWGSCRGYIWKRSFEYYMDMPWYCKIFGTGPDTMERVLTPVYGEEMIAKFDAYYDNAHNEYLQYLVTTGIAGLMAYLGVIVSSIKNGLKNAGKDKNKIPFLIAVICYLMQALVNINQVITTPLMFLCLAMLVSQGKEEKELIQNS